MPNRPISSLSTEYDRWAVLAPSTPTGGTVEFAYVKQGSAAPAGGAWFAGTWEVAALSTGEWVARALIGPTGHALTPGLYDVWIRITLAPEVVVRQVGTCTVI